MPISRPRGLARTTPPAATTAICAAQQLPKLGTLNSIGGLGELDLRADPGIVLIDGEAAAGPGDAVILLQRRALGQAGAGIGGMHDLADGAGQAVLQHADIEIAGRRGAAGGELAPAPPCDSRR